MQKEISVRKAVTISHILHIYKKQLLQKKKGITRNFCLFKTITNNVYLLLNIIDNTQVNQTKSFIDYNIF